MSTQDSARRKWRIAIVSAVIVLALALIGVVAYMRAPRPTPTRLAPASQSQSSVQTSALAGASTATVSGTGAQTSPTPTPVPTKPVPPAKTATPAPAKKPLTANDVAHQATFVLKTRVASGGARTVTMDYVQILTGHAAQVAASAHGDTVENDYYIANDNPKLRTFQVSSAVVIKLHPAEGPQYSRDFAFSEFRALIGGHTATYGGKHYDWGKETPYYVNVKNGKVTRIEQQWVP